MVMILFTLPLVCQTVVNTQSVATFRRLKKQNNHSPQQFLVEVLYIPRLPSTNSTNIKSFSFVPDFASLKFPEFSANRLTAVSNLLDNFHPCCPPYLLFK